MTRERHRKLQALFDGAVELAGAGERAAFVARECGGDAAMLAELRALLDSYDGWMSQLGLPAPRPPRCGAWECVEALGNGGMGVV